MSSVSSIILAPFELQDVDLTLVSVVSVRSVVLGFQYRCAVAETDFVGRFRDDPKTLTLPGRVRREEAAAVNQGGIVEVAILIVEVAPVAVTWRARNSSAD
jgi:hypothetical protein